MSLCAFVQNVHARHWTCVFISLCVNLVCCLYDVFMALCVILIKKKEKGRLWGVAINYYTNYTDFQDATGIQEWESSGGTVREGPVIKPSPVTLGRICSQWERALGPKQEPDEPVTVSIILLSGVSVSWDAGCWSYSCRVTVPIVSCEHDNKAAMWTKGWGSRLLTPLCTGQLDCSLRWKGKQMNSQQSALEIRKNKSELDPMIIRLVK